MTDKMRSEFERDHGKLSENPDLKTMFECREPLLRWAWQAAQAEQSVPGVGEPVAWGVTKRYEDNVWFISDSRFTAQYYAQMYAHRIGENPDQVVTPLYRKPTTSISAAELERLQRNDARYMWLRDLKNDETAVRLLKAECDTELDEAIDAAIAGEK